VNDLSSHPGKPTLTLILFFAFKILPPIAAIMAIYLGYDLFVLRVTGKAPSINLPKGGGATDDKGSVNSATGTGSLTVPVFTSPRRRNFQPEPSLSYYLGVESDGS